MTAQLSLLLGAAEHRAAAATDAPRTPQHRTAARTNAQQSPTTAPTETQILVDNSTRRVHRRTVAEMGHCSNCRCRAVVLVVLRSERDPQELCSACWGTDGERSPAAKELHP